MIIHKTLIWLVRWKREHTMISRIRITRVMETRDTTVAFSVSIVELMVMLMTNAGRCMVTHPTLSPIHVV